jgi:hypothetical protein
MLVEIGPVPSQSALAYVAFCRDRLAEVVADPGDLASALTPELLASFAAGLESWELVARTGPVFLWSLDIEVAQVEYQFVAFVRIVLGGDPVGRTSESANDREVELRRPFRVALVNGTLAALEREGQGSAALAAELRAQWPDDDIA